MEMKYPWRPLKCMRCKVFGHSDDHCPALPKVASAPAVDVMENSGTVSSAKVVASPLGLRVSGYTSSGRTMASPSTPDKSTTLLKL